MNARRATCTQATIDGRVRKARQFANAFDVVFELADDAEDVADACVTLAVHAGIAACDVICCRRLGHFAQGQDHQGATQLLRQVHRELADDLATLLALKSLAGYSAKAVTATELKKARRAMEHLIAAI